MATRSHCIGSVNWEFQNYTLLRLRERMNRHHYLRLTGQKKEARCRAETRMTQQKESVPQNRQNCLALVSEHLELSGMKEWGCPKTRKSCIHSWAKDYQHCELEWTKNRESPKWCCHQFQKWGSGNSQKEARMEYISVIRSKGKALSTWAVLKSETRRGRNKICLEVNFIVYLNERGAPHPDSPPPLQCQDFCTSFESSPLGAISCEALLSPRSRCAAFAPSASVLLLPKKVSCLRCPPASSPLLCSPEYETKAISGLHSLRFC